MTPFEISIIILLVASTIIILAVVRITLRESAQTAAPSAELLEWLKQVSVRMETTTTTLDRKMTDNLHQFNNRLDKAAFVIADVQKSIGEFSEIGRSMQSLQELLQSPKLRGNIGEHILKELLSQYLPRNTFTLQYSFKNGNRVDAVIRTSQGLIPIDAKFPLENFRKMNDARADDGALSAVKRDFTRDVKKHVEAISKKYIVPAEGTVDYAIMYVPSEAIFYEIINSAELFEFTAEQRVLPVSPLSFYAYLRAILMSFEGQKIEHQAKEILRAIQAISKEQEKTEAAFSTLSRHLTNAYNQAQMVRGALSEMGNKVRSIDVLRDEKENEILP